MSSLKAKMAPQENLTTDNQMTPSSPNTTPKTFGGVPTGVWLLSIASMLITLSSCIMTTLAPIYLMDVLKVSKKQLGNLEGTVEFISYLLRFGAGYISDFFTQRKVFIVLGFGFSTGAKAFIAFVTSYGMLFMGKIVDRIGNGIQAAPRDAMLGDFSLKGHSAKAYGLSQSLRKLGSVLGSFFVVLMFMGAITEFFNSFGVTFTDESIYKVIFFSAVVTSVLGLAFMIFFVPNPKHKLPNKGSSSNNKSVFSYVENYIIEFLSFTKTTFNTLAALLLGYLITRLFSVSSNELTLHVFILLGTLTALAVFNRKLMLKAYQTMGRPFWLVILLAGIYGISHFNESFLQVIGRDIGMAQAEVAFIVTILCLATATTAYPLGLMADKFGKKKMLAAGFLFMFIADVILATMHNRVGIYTATWFWGMHWSVTQGVLLALLKDVAPKSRLGAAFGIFYLTLGISHLGANMIGGRVWDAYGSINTFLGAEKMFSLGAILVLGNMVLLYVTARLKLFRMEK